MGSSVELAKADGGGARAEGLRPPDETRLTQRRRTGEPEGQAQKGPIHRQVSEYRTMLDTIECKQTGHLRAVVGRLRLHRGDGGRYEKVHAVRDCLVRDCLVRDLGDIVGVFFQRGSLPLREAGTCR